MAIELGEIINVEAKLSREINKIRELQRHEIYGRVQKHKEQISILIRVLSNALNDLGDCRKAIQKQNYAKGLKDVQKATNNLIECSKFSFILGLVGTNIRYFTRECARIQVSLENTIRTAR
ncbi:MAG TPA: hypothetical protein HA282_05555 [Nanoarchaeota archaeon]|nr:MAG: hypothetical protein QT01_C0001G0118 [archaeon GW2011_AR6]MBS3082551.1 hypothetical protein [Candidatus Pacearchaeota archaeon]HIH17488.1 hypothetical protein [Nanoarchaeota archaeon]HIH33929.1 hypothetical protein [Nanoarchaeota archaeon]HIH51780.1 hypothetical protein [Nanoarchaeota archaeon]